MGLFFGSKGQMPVNTRRAYNARLLFKLLECVNVLLCNNYNTAALITIFLAVFACYYCSLLATMSCEVLSMKCLVVAAVHFIFWCAGDIHDVCECWTRFGIWRWHVFLSGIKWFVIAWWMTDLRCDLMWKSRLLGFNPAWKSCNTWSYIPWFFLTFSS